ncbi:MAG: polynucleotide adenylyltransferase PcnB [Gammaproteobacteria bacterium]|nr:polynucleotide adenylyltransferase PcnB [Gammaproteobacteria bacterium]
MTKHSKQIKQPSTEPIVIRRADHGISRKEISPSALKVLYKLNDAGFDAYMVGGGVRDLLVNLHPKDFDIATNASPEQVSKVFRNSRIIGRRFRIVHVHFGREIIEVSTFRAQSSQSTKVSGNSLARNVKHLDSVQNQSGMLLRDNVYGTIEEDAVRRDFTVNALYYTVQGFTVYDFCHGMEDIQNRILRIIGDAEQRYIEDPVRILRAIRLASKLNFTIEEKTEAPIKACASLLESTPPARLFDEFMKLFFNGNGLLTFNKLYMYQVFGVLFPPLSNIISFSDSRDRLMLEGAFRSTDERILNKKSVTPAFLLAAILWPAVRRSYQQKLSTKLPPMLAMHDAGQEIIENQLAQIAIPKRFSIPMREIWEYQLRLERHNGKKAELLVTKKRFRAAYDFLLLREASGEEMKGLGQWWTSYQTADAQQRQTMRQSLQQSSLPKPRKRKVKSESSTK